MFWLSWFACFDNIGMRFYIRIQNKQNRYKVPSETFRIYNSISKQNLLQQSKYKKYNVSYFISTCMLEFLRIEDELQSVTYIGKVSFNAKK